jgi:hypothetical protein
MTAAPVSHIASFTAAATAAGLCSFLGSIV